MEARTSGWLMGLDLLGGLGDGFLLEFLLRFANVEGRVMVNMVSNISSKAQYHTGPLTPFNPRQYTHHPRPIPAPLPQPNPLIGSGAASSV